MSINTKARVGGIVFGIFKYVSMILAAVVSLVPVCVCVLTEFKTNDEYAFTSVLSLPKSFLYLDNFKVAFTQANMLRCFANTRRFRATSPRRLRRPGLCGRRI